MKHVTIKNKNAFANGNVLSKIIHSNL